MDVRTKKAKRTAYNQFLLLLLYLAAGRFVALPRGREESPGNTEHHTS